MHDGALSFTNLTWRELLDKHHGALVDDLTRCLDSDLETAAAQAVAAERTQASAQLARACGEARRSQAEVLNQSLRRLRNATGEESILRTLSETCAPYADVSVVLVFENNQARAAACHGSESGALSFDSFDINAAPSLVAAIESRDPVVALAGETELSPDLARMLNAADNGESRRNAYLFPLTARHSVVAMLIASGSTPVISAPIELLCEAAGMRLETLLPAADRALPAKTAAERVTWDALSSEDQKLHLQAQRVARVRVASMRLDNEEALRNGIASNDIYGALESVIDAARRHFLEAFLAKSPTMVDYLHLEVLRSLAHDDDRLLGHNYPGPMV